MRRSVQPLKRDDPKPNVLILMTDQHRFDMMTCAGRNDVPTPNIDRIAARGVRFDNAYCPYPSCAASRNALLTGRYPHHAGVVSNKDKLDWKSRTMAHHFSDHGYLSALIGKMHFNDANKHGFAYHVSINDWMTYLGPKAAVYASEHANHPAEPKYFDTVTTEGAGFPDIADLWEGASPWLGQVKRLDFGNLASELPADDHLDGFIARESVKFIRRYRDEPFFLISSFMKPHAPFFPPREFADKYPVADMELPEAGDAAHCPGHVRRRIQWLQSRGEQHLRAFRAGYRGNLAFVDRCVGQVYDALEEMNLLERTIVIYTSDHGEMDGDKGLYGKGNLYEPAVKVPLIVSCPGRIPEHRATAAVAEYIGLYPTLADMTGTSPCRGPWLHRDDDAARLDGASFADVLHYPERDSGQTAFARWNTGDGESHGMVRRGRYKYIHHPSDPDELYDLQQDPGERVNVIDLPGHASAAAEMGKLLRERMNG